MEIVKYGQPVLRSKGARIESVTDDIRQLADAMVATMRESRGVGLAAQQVGRALMLCVVDVTGVEDRPSELLVDGKPEDVLAWMPLVLLNPELELGKEKAGGEEGCLSFPGIFAPVARSVVARVKARLLDGRDVEFEARGFLARVIQHEVDHLNGVLFIDRMNSASKALLAKKLKRMVRG